MSFQFPSSFGGGGGGAVNSVNGFTGNVVLTKANLGLGNVDNTSDANKPVSTATQAALNLKQDLISANDRELIFDNAGTIEGIASLFVSTPGGLSESILLEPNNDVANTAVNQWNMNVEPLQNSPDDSMTGLNINLTLDANDSGFDYGTNGTAANLFSNQIGHAGSGDVGSLTIFNNNFNLGNGTDPINVNGISYGFGFANINALVNMTGPLQGWGFQPNIAATATMDTGSYANAFYDFANFLNTDGVNSYASFSAGPTIASIKNNSNYTAVNLNPTINDFQGNAGYSAIAIAGTLTPDLNNTNISLINISTNVDETNSLTVFNGGSQVNELNQYYGLYLNPNITLANQVATGLYINMSNVTGYAGTQSTVTIQDLTYTFNAPADNNAYTIEYIGGGTAGSEVVSLVGQDITVQIQNGVSTATQIKAAVDATTGINAAITVTISGVGGNPQVIDGPDSFAGGTNPATIRAIDVIGDVNIQGDLSFTGGISIGQLSAFYSQAVINNGGTPASVHSLISSITAANNAVVANADTIGVNTAALIQIGDNAAITTAFLGITALGLPAVVSIGAGATVDRIAGSVFALSLSGAPGAGTINEVSLCKAAALPDGNTTVNRLYGYEMSLPFGNVGTEQWGVWVSPNIQNYLAGSLLVGGTPTSDDTVSNASTGMEIRSTTKAMLLSRMNTAQEGALTPIDGMIIYNNQTNKFRGYANGSWVDLH